MTALAPRPIPASAARLRVDRCWNGSVYVSFLDAEGEPFAHACLALETAEVLGLTPHALAAEAKRQRAPSPSGAEA